MCDGACLLSVELSASDGTLGLSNDQMLRMYIHLQVKESVVPVKTLYLVVERAQMLGSTTQ